MINCKVILFSHSCYLSFIVTNSDAFVSADYRSDVIMKGKKIMKDNQEYLKFDKIRIRLHIGKTKIKFENLFSNDPILRQISNDIVNDNSELFINEIKPALENSLAKKFTEIANKITLKFTYNELFP